MNVRNCRRCRKLFNYVVGPIVCPQCRDELEAEFQKVKKYVQEHPRVDIRTVSEECEVDVSQIRQWVREERLEFADDSAVGLNCERCGKIIKSVTLANINGSTIMSALKPVSHVTFDVTSLISGIYIINIVTEDKTYSRKIMKVE